MGQIKQALQIGNEQKILTGRFFFALYAKQLNLYIIIFTKDLLIDKSLLSNIQRMKSISKNTFCMLVLMSLLLIQVYTGFSTYENGACTTPGGIHVKKTENAPSDGKAPVAGGITDACLPLEETFDGCKYYLASNNACYCDDYANSPTFLAGGIVKACIPATQNLLNGVCSSTSPGNYNCTCSATPYINIVSLSNTSDDNNAGGPTRGCSQYALSNCATWKVKSTVATTNVIIIPTLVKALQLICKTCNPGFNAWNTANGVLTYDASVEGPGCPKDGIFDSTCPKATITWATNVYKCSSCPADTSQGTTLISFTTSQTQPVTVGCLPQGAYPYDKNCLTYTYNSDYTKLVCNKCKSGTLITADSDTGTKTYTYCTSQTIIPGCSKYVAAQTLSDSSAITCQTCQADYDYVITAVSVNILNKNSGTSTGVCVTKGRYILEPALCSFYNTPTLATATYLSCNTCKANSGSPPCYASNSKATTYGQCTGGKLSVLVAGALSTTPSCLSDTIIDHCKVYTKMINTASGDGCDICEDGFILVDTDKSMASGTTTLLPKVKICIPVALKDPNCLRFSNVDLTCLNCTNNLLYSTTLKRCQINTDASPSCANSVMVGTTQICTNCPANFTMVDGKCVAAVLHCSSLSSTGACSACVSNYQLVGNACVPKPQNCATVDTTGACTACKAGFSLNSQNRCSPASANTCPTGQVPSNGACVPVQVKITDCVAYTTDGKCQLCGAGKKPSDDGKSCVAGSSGNVPGAKPCPADSDKVTYKHDPSNPLGDCVAVDVKCANARDDGHCTVCKEGEYANSLDGLCYEVDWSLINGGN